MASTERIMGRFRFIIVAVSLVSIGSVGCASIGNRQGAENTAIKIESAPVNENEEVTVGPGDLIEIKSYTESLPSGEYPIMGSGTIVYPYLGEIKVAGMTLSEIQSLIISRLKDGYFRHPVISVTIKELNSQKVTLFGEVKKPGVISYRRTISLLQVLSMAGGLSPNADKDAITLVRKNGNQKYRIKISINDIINGDKPDILIKAGDVIIVPKKEF